MKRPVRLLSMIAAALLAAPAAMAGDIVKCIDSGGHVTLTDQPCAAGTTATPLMKNADTRAVPQPLAAPQRHVLPVAELRHPAWRPAVAAPAPLARDVATLKAARRMLMLQEAARPRLAGLN